jgi:histidine triad (HIT) family protein
MLKSEFSLMLEGKVPCHKIYEDEHTFVILDDRPLTRGHCLVITKEQIDHLDDCSPELYEAVFKTTRTISRKLKKTLRPKRIAIVVHGFEIPHVHVHVVPVYTGKELQLAAKERDVPKAGELEELRELLSLHKVP